mmetsp:Transcript_47407/g.93979  ORF Transcript_47407/g.93979 Transcript_47407/m.93979 type:complete len:168 (+) Transcript_47407:364-867(+)
MITEGKYAVGRVFVFESNAAYGFKGACHDEDGIGGSDEKFVVKRGGGGWWGMIVMEGGNASDFSPSNEEEETASSLKSVMFVVLELLLPPPQPRCCNNDGGGIVGTEKDELKANRCCFIVAAPSLLSPLLFSEYLADMPLLLLLVGCLPRNSSPEVAPTFPKATSSL